MRIGLIDVDGHNFPNLPLMKLSAYHKSAGDQVEWYNLVDATAEFMTTGKNMYDKVYMSKVFTFTEDYQNFVFADEVVKGGTGYEYPSGGKPLSDEIEHIYPDYSIYYDLIPETKDTAYGFLTRGCPRGCDFCIVKDKEGRCSKKVADLSEFWHGQKNIEICDPNLFACKDWKELAQQIIDSKAWINFNQGCDIRIMTEEKAEYIKRMKIKQIHFAWDKYEDKDVIIPKFKAFKKITQWDKRKLPVYVLTNFNTTNEQDLERIYTLRDLGYWAYVMIYERDKLPKGHITRKLQRWCNNRFIFESTPDFNDYERQREGIE